MSDNEAEAGGPGKPQGSGAPAPATTATTSPTRLTYLQRLRMIRDQPGALESLLLAVGCILLVLGIWHFLSGGFGNKRIVNAFILPTIAETFGSFGTLWNERALARGILWSLGRVLTGFLAGAAIAIPLGVIAGSYLRLNAFLRPLSVFGRSIPIAALIPLTVVWFNVGEMQKVMFILIASIAFVFFDTTHAVEGVSNRFLDTAYTLGARIDRKAGAISAGIIAVFYALLLALLPILTTAFSAGSIDWAVAGEKVATGPTLLRAVIGWVGGFALWYPIRSHQVLSKVVLPLALPNVVNSMRLLFGLGFGYIILAEVLDSDYGLGKIIFTSQRRGSYEHIYLILIVIALVAFTIDRTVYRLQKRWFPYREIP
jgi:ABC-type nitrate/sulfonate/bicarbonate transport system permease component